MGDMKRQVTNEYVVGESANLFKLYFTKCHLSEQLAFCESRTQTSSKYWIITYLENMESRHCRQSKLGRGKWRCLGNYEIREIGVKPSSLCLVHFNNWRVKFKCVICRCGRSYYVIQQLTGKLPEFHAYCLESGQPGTVLLRCIWLSPAVVHWTW